MSSHKKTYVNLRTFVLSLLDFHIKIGFGAEVVSADCFYLSKTVWAGRSSLYLGLYPKTVDVQSITLNKDEGEGML